MKANQSDDAHSDPHAGELPSKAELHRAASKLRVYEWEHFAYTDAANTADSNRKLTASGWLTRLKVLLRNLLS